MFLSSDIAITISILFQLTKKTEKQKQRLNLEKSMRHFIQRAELGGMDIKIALHQA